MLVEPISAIKKVASAGPIAKPAAKIASWIELALSKVIFAGSATSGTSDFLAVPPPGATTPRAIPIAIKSGMVSPMAQSTRGIKSAVKAVRNSTQTAVRLRPKRSITDPTSGAKIRPGIPVIATTKPAVAAEPTSSSAIQGMAINTIDPEITLVMDANWVRMKGAKVRCT